MREPVGYRKDGRPIWPILGAEDGGEGSGDGGSPGDGGGGSGSGDGQGDDLTRLRDAIAKEREQRKAFEKEAKAGRDAVAKLAEIEEANKDANQKAIDAATKSAREETATEVAAKYKRRIVTAEVKAAAGGKLADPMDAVRLLDLDEFELDDNDELDSQKVAKAIDQLLEAKPYLKGAAQQKRPSHDGGTRTTEKITGREAGLAEAQRRFGTSK